MKNDNDFCYETSYCKKCGVGLADAVENWNRECSPPDNLILICNIVSALIMILYSEITDQSFSSKFS